MKTTTFINWAAGRKTVRMAVRFPVSVLLLVWLAVKLFSGGVDSGVDNIRLYVFFLGGVPVSLAAALWLEDHLRGLKLHTATAAVTLLWGAYSYFGQTPMSQHHYFLDSGWFDFLPALRLIGTEVLQGFLIFSFLEALAIAAGAALLVFIPFWGKGGDIAFGNFFSRICLHFTVAGAIGILLKVMLTSIFNLGHCGCCPASMSAETSIFLFCYILFLPLWVMAHIPGKKAKHNNKAARNRFPKAAGLFLRPVIAIYAISLYVYYLYHWDLWVKGKTEALPEHIAVPIFILAAGGLLAIMLLYPSRLRGESPYEDEAFDEDFDEDSECVYWHPPSNYSLSIAKQSRWFCAAILPLLILMTVAITIRVNEYGMTIMRGYLILLNLWFYGIYAYLFFTNARGVKWIPITLGALLILSSVGPWSVSNATKHMLIADMARAMDDPELYFYHNSARDMIYYALSDGGDFVYENYLPDYVSDEDNLRKVKDKRLYLLQTYNWESKNKYGGKYNDEFENYTAGDFKVRPTGKRKSVAIIGYAGNDTILDIPSKLDGKTVAEIGKDAFADRGIVRVTIPNGVTVIGDRAFMQNRLTGIAIPNGVRAIGAEAFLANELTNAAIPGSVADIGERAFAYNALSRVTIPNGVAHIGEEAFAHNRLTSAAVPKRVAVIRDGAFADNQITRITIGRGVRAIGSEAFARNRLTDVNIPRGVKFIAPNAFAENEQDIAVPER